MLLWTCMYMYLLEYMFSVLLSIHLGVEILVPVKVFSTVMHNFTFSLAMNDKPNISTSSLAFVIFHLFFFIIANLEDVKWYFIVVNGLLKSPHVQENLEDYEHAQSWTNTEQMSEKSLPFNFWLAFRFCESRKWRAR